MYINTGIIATSNNNYSSKTFTQLINQCTIYFQRDVTVKIYKNDDGKMNLTVYDNDKYQHYYC